MSLHHEYLPFGPSSSTSAGLPNSRLRLPYVGELPACLSIQLSTTACTPSPPPNNTTHLISTTANMPLEAVMIIADNSESSRNGDYQPTRFDAQADSINILFDSITNGNPESSVGLMSMGGKGPEVLSTLTTERGKLLDGLHRTKKKVSGKSHLATGIQIASVSKALPSPAFGLRTVPGW